MNPGESAAECARREALEETGWEVEVTGLLGLYTDPTRHTFEYPNGDRVQFVAMVFDAVALRAVGDGDRETDAVGFFAHDALPSPLHEPDREPIADAFAVRGRPFVR